jgi:serine/threonine-protein kinase RsbW
METYNLIYPSSAESEAEMLDALESLIRREGIGKPLAFNFMLAVSEAFTNALIHGNRMDPRKQITIRVRVTEMDIFADITDEGQRGLESVRERRPSEELSENGRGIALIHHYARDVEFSETETGGLKVSIHFDRKRNKREVTQ